LNRKTVFFNARFLSEAITGLQRWGRETLSALDRALAGGKLDGAEDLELVALTPRLRKGSPALPSWQKIEIREVGPFHSHLWEQTTLRRVLGGKPLVCMKFSGPIHYGGPTATMIHDDLIWEQEESYSRPFLTWYRFMIPHMARRSDVLMTLSADGRSRLEKRLDLPKESMRVMGCGHEHVFQNPADPSVLERLGLNETQFMLAVSSHMLNKNFAGAATAMSAANLPDIPLVVVGGETAQVFRTTPNLPNNTLCAGRIEDGELRSLYEHALGLLFPSFHEGFGLPPLEAMALGCPVIASNRSSIPEVCGEAALLVDPQQESELVAAIQRLAGEEGLADELRHKGQRQAALHSWDTCSRRLWECVRDLSEISSN